MVWGHNRWLLQSRSSLSFCFVLATLGGMQDQFPDQESNPGPLRWEYGVLTTGPPGTSSSVLNKKKKIDQKMGLVLNPSPSCVCWVHLLIHPTLHQTKEGSHLCSKHSVTDGGGPPRSQGGRKMFHPCGLRWMDSKALRGQEIDSVFLWHGEKKYWSKFHILGNNVPTRPQAGLVHSVNVGYAPLSQTQVP